MRDKLIETIAEQLNSEFEKKGDKIARFLDEDENDVNVKEFISTGSLLLDWIISNRIKGGFPVGRITELMGLEGSGKSLLCGYAIKNCQLDNGIPILIDTEYAVSRDFLKAIGVNIQNLIWISPETLEDCFQTIEKLVEIVKKKNPDKKVLICLDSVSALTTKKELYENNFEKQGYATDKSILLSMAFRKIKKMISEEKICFIATNQYRMKLDASPFGDKWTTSGGKALAYYSSVRIKVTTAQGIKDKDGNRIGSWVDFEVSKNRLTAPHRSVKVPLYYSSGFSNSESIVNFLKEKKVIKTAGPTYVVPFKNEELKIQGKMLYERIENDEEFRNEIYQKAFSLIEFKYDENKNKTKNSDDIIISNNSDYNSNVNDDSNIQKERELETIESNNKSGDSSRTEINEKNDNSSKTEIKENDENSYRIEKNKVNVKVDKLKIIDSILRNNIL